MGVDVVRLHRRQARTRGVQVSARVYAAGVRTMIGGHHGTPVFVCIEDREHTARAAQAIRERRRREGMGVVTNH